MNENVLAATTQMFFAFFLHSVPECCIFAIMPCKFSCYLPFNR